MPKEIAAKLDIMFAPRPRQTSTDGDGYVRIVQFDEGVTKAAGVLNRDAGSVRSWNPFESRGGSAGCTRQTEGTEETIFIRHACAKVKEQVRPRNKCVRDSRPVLILIIFLCALKHGREGGACVDSIISKTLVIAQRQSVFIPKLLV